MTTSEKILSRLQTDAANAVQIAQYWKHTFPAGSPVPADSQFALWARLHRENIGAMLDGIDQTAAKFVTTRGRMDEDYLVKFCSKCANTLQMQRRRTVETKAA